MGTRYCKGCQASSPAPGGARPASAPAASSQPLSGTEASTSASGQPSGTRPTARRAPGAAGSSNPASPSTSTTPRRRVPRLESFSLQPVRRRPERPSHPDRPAGGQRDRGDARCIERHHPATGAARTVPTVRHSGLPAAPRGGLPLLVSPSVTRPEKYRRETIITDGAWWMTRWSPLQRSLLWHSADMAHHGPGVSRRVCPNRSSPRSVGWNHDRDRDWDRDRG